jgi:hypothetical protein
MIERDLTIVESKATPVVLPQVFSSIPNAFPRAGLISGDAWIRRVVVVGGQVAGTSVCE